MESLLLFRRALSSPTMCRFIPALSIPAKFHINTDSFQFTLRETHQAEASLQSFIAKKFPGENPNTGTARA
jgi:hypothetical protein